MSKNNHESTRVIGQGQLNVDGVAFQWWAVGEQPALVTVRTRFFGTLSEFTDKDPADYATVLAKRLLKQHCERAEAARAKNQSPAAGASVLKKPGWFSEGDDSVDFSSTYV